MGGVNSVVSNQTGFQAEVARRIGTLQAMVVRWETGKAAPTRTSLRRFAEAAGARLRIEFAFERN